MVTPAWLYVDPFCPWCYQTARWMRRLEELQVVDISWGFFSLEIANGPPGDVDLDRYPHSVPYMRIALLVRDELGQAAAGRFYGAVGARMHERDERLRLLSTMEGALVEAGLDPDLAARALADESTGTRLVNEHQAHSTRGFGVPTLVLDREDGPAMFGPVIANVPDDEAALELWEHVAWIIRNPNVYELKRDRAELPDLEGLRMAQIRRAARPATSQP